MMPNAVSSVYHISGWERILYTAIPILAVLGLLITIGLTLYQSYRNCQTAKAKDSLAVQRVPASLQSKRMHSSPTGEPTYFATFSIQGGRALEFSIPETEYEKLSEGSAGELQYQGTHFVLFHAHDNL